MSEPPSHNPDLTALLSRASVDVHAANALLDHVYQELKVMAQHFLRSESSSAVQATALVHDAWLRLGGNEHMGWENRRHFFGAAAQAMRRILVDEARRAASQKRGGRLQRITYVDIADSKAPNALGVLDLHEALNHLTSIDANAARVVELRYFVGLTLEDCAAALDRSLASVKRDWAYARAWLYERLGSSENDT